MARALALESHDSLSKGYPVAVYRFYKPHPSQDGVIVLLLEEKHDPCFKIEEQRFLASKKRNRKTGWGDST